MLDDDRLDALVPKGVLHLESAVPAGFPARRVGPHHVDAASAFGRERELEELVLSRKTGVYVAIPTDGRVHDGFGDAGLGDERGLGAGDETSIGGTQAGDIGGGGKHVQRRDAEKRPLEELELVRPGLTNALHAQERYLQACRLVGEAAADEATAVAMRDGYRMLCPVTREGLDGVCGNPADLLGPLGRLGHAVLAAQDIVLEVLEAHGMRLEVVLVVRIFLDPGVGDCELQGGVGVGKHGNPLVCMDAVGIVDVGRDVDLPHADFREPETQAACHLSAPSQWRRLGVASPEQHGIAVFRDVLDDVVLEVLLAEGIHAPDVLGAPVPAFPGVRLTGLDRESTAKVQQLGDAAVRGVDDLRLAVAVDFQQDGFRTVFVVHALYLGSANLGRLVPGDALVIRRPAVLGVALAIGVPIDALHGVGDAVLGVDALFVA